MYDIVIMGNHSLIHMFGCDLSPFLACLFINLEISSFEFLKFWPSHTLYLKINSSSSQLYVFIEGIHLCFQPRKLDVILDTKFSSINRHLLRSTVSQVPCKVLGIWCHISKVSIFKLQLSVIVT